MTQNITKEVQRTTRKDRKEENTWFFVVVPGTIQMRSFVRRNGAGTTRGTGAASTVFGLPFLPSSFFLNRIQRKYGSLIKEVERKNK